MKVDFLDRFSKNALVSNFIKIRPLGAKLFHADGRMEGRVDRHGETNWRSLQFCKRA
jgi:hypothetical protein